MGNCGASGEQPENDISEAKNRITNEEKKHLELIIRLKLGKFEVVPNLIENTIDVEMPYEYTYVSNAKGFKDILINKSGVYYLDTTRHPPNLRIEKYGANSDVVKILSVVDYNTYGINPGEDEICVICHCNGSWIISDGQVSRWELQNEEGLGGKKLYGVL